MSTIAKVTAAQLAALARSLVGLAYVLGAPSPYNVARNLLKALDCSGLVCWLLYWSGNGIGDDTAAGLYNRTIAVKAGTEKPGDLVFLRNNPARSNGIGHVAMLISKLSNGDWEIVEARGRAAGVVLTTLSYWKTRKYYTGVRRLKGFTLATTPTAPATPTAELRLRIAELNCLDPNIHQGDGKLHPLTAARKAALVKSVKKAAANIYLLSECPEQTRDALRAGLPGGPGRWKVWERGSQAILFDSKRLAYSTSQKVAFEGYHGGVIAPFTDRATGRKVVLGSFHLPADTSASQAKQQAYLASFLAAMPKLSGVRIVGGDGANSASWAAGWTDARTAAANSSTRQAPTWQGKAITDRIWSDTQTPVTWRGYTVLDTGAGSDHDLIVTALTIPATNTL